MSGSKRVVEKAILPVYVLFIFYKSVYGHFFKLIILYLPFKAFIKY
jgi:hypothetical protein